MRLKKASECAIVPEVLLIEGEGHSYAGQRFLFYLTLTTRRGPSFGWGSLLLSFSWSRRRLLGLLPLPCR